MQITKETANTRRITRKLRRPRRSTRARHDRCYYYPRHTRTRVFCCTIKDSDALSRFLSPLSSRRSRAIHSANVDSTRQSTLALTDLGSTARAELSAPSAGISSTRSSSSRLIVGVVPIVRGREIECGEDLAGATSTLLFFFFLDCPP